MNRMTSFEKDWADRHDLPVETLAQYRHADGSGYRLPGMAKNYRTWCNAADHTMSMLVLACSGAALQMVRENYSEPERVAMLDGEPVPEG